MSRSYDIACNTCGEALWIGQGWPLTQEEVAQQKEDLRFIYHGMPDRMQQLQDFLFRHEGTHEQHELVFIDSEYLDGSKEWHRADDEDCDCERCQKEKRT